MSAQYWIAQYVQDLFRNEPRNIAVFVKTADSVAARYLGSDDQDKIDGRRLGIFNQPDVYKQWVEYWKSLIEAENTDELENSSSAHFRIISGGSVSNIAADSSSTVASSLYSLLVSSGYAAAIDSDVDLSTVKIKLIDEVELSLQALMNSGEDSLTVANPVRVGESVQGKAALHDISFSQLNGSLALIEPVDFTDRSKSRAVDHAGLTAYKYSDITNANDKVAPYSIVKIDESDKGNRSINYGLKILEKESNVVMWNDFDARKQFIDDRRDAAIH